MPKLLILVLFLFLTSCATKIHGLRKSADFTYHNIQAGHLTIGGVVHANQQWNYNQKISIANQFRVDVQDSRRDLLINSTNYLVKKIGRGLFRETLREITEDAALSDHSLDVLSRTIEDKRYIAFARIESDRVENSRNSQNISGEDGKPTGEKKLTMQTKRSMDINFFVYDIRKKHLAWNGLIKKHALKTTTYYTKEKNSVGKFIDLLTGNDNKYPYPKKPNEKDILNKAFKGFAENLPIKN